MSLADNNGVQTYFLQDGLGSAAVLSPTEPGGWALVGVVCVEGGVAAIAGGTVGILEIRHALSSWQEEAEPSGSTGRSYPGKE